MQLFHTRNVDRAKYACIATSPAWSQIRIWVAAGKCADSVKSLQSPCPSSVAHHGTAWTAKHPK